MYLDDLISGQVDPETAAIYLSPSHLHTQDPAITRLEAQVGLHINFPTWPGPSSPAILTDLVVGLCRLFFLHRIVTVPLSWCYSTIYWTVDFWML